MADAASVGSDAGSIRHEVTLHLIGRVIAVIESIATMTAGHHASISRRRVFGGGLTFQVAWIPGGDPNPNLLSEDERHDGQANS